MNIWDILIIVLLAAIVIRAIWKIRKPSGNSCHSGCASCPHCGACEKKPEKP